MSSFLINPYVFAAPVGPTDPYFSNVSLLLHGDGANGSTTIIDSSPSPKTVTAVGDAQISTAQKKFGTGSLYFDGLGDFLTCTPSADYAFATGDFTVESWVYPGSFPNTYHTVLSTRGITGSATAWNLSIVNNGTLIVYLNAFAYVGTVTGAVALNTWSHIAMVRSSGSLQVYVNGTPNRATATSLASNLTTESLWIGTVGGVASGPGGGGDPFNGYIDELRITKGIARYQSAFTPPTAPFPDA